MLIIHATILTMNAQREIIEDGAIAIQGNRIVAVDKTPVLQVRYPSEEILDQTGKLIIPGLIDTHVHLAQAMLRGCADDMELI